MNDQFKIGERRNDLIIELLKEIKSQLEEQEILKKEILDFDEARKYLRVSDSMLYKLTSRCEIPFTKPNGKKLYFLRSELDNWRLQEPSKSEGAMINEAKEWLNNNLNLKA